MLLLTEFIKQCEASAGVVSSWLDRNRSAFFKEKEAVGVGGGLLQACKQWWSECWCCSLGSFISTGLHCIIKIRAWDGSKGFSLFLIDFGKSWVKHRGTARFATERWHASLVPIGGLTSSLNWQWGNLEECFLRLNSRRTCDANPINMWSIKSGAYCSPLPKLMSDAIGALTSHRNHASM